MQQALDDLSGRIAQLKNAQQRNAKAQGLTTRRQSISEKSVALRKTLALWSTYKDASIVNETQKQSLNHDTNLAVKAVKDAQTKFSAVDAPDNHPELGASINEPIEDLLHRMNEVIVTAWDSHIETLKSRIRNEPQGLMALKDLPEFKSDVAEIIGLERRLNLQYQTQALTKKEIDDLDTAVTQLNCKIAVVLDKIPSNVLEFVKEATSGGANLDALTPEVRTWASDNQLTAYFKIVLDSDGSR